jgi:uncharacterized iron-regulated protein
MLDLVTHYRIALAVTLLLGLVACSRPTRIAPIAWHAPLDHDHPLTGRIWDVGAGRFVEEPALVERLSTARFVMLGEKHDNLDHHVLQARLVRALTAAGRRPAVAFEMLTAEQAPALARFLATAPRDAGGLGAAVGWADTGWPEWPMYQPIAQAALDAGLPIVAANVPNATARALGMGDRAALPSTLVARYRLDRDLPADVQAEMAEEIRAAHCGHANDTMVRNMIVAQRVRDAAMAESLLDTGRDGVLITGSGHARSDRGVPASLRIVQPQSPIVSVAFVEVEADHPTPADYPDHFGTARLPFDYVWFTPRLDDENPCEAFRKSLERLRR